MVAHVGDFGLAKILSEFVDPNQSSSIGIRGPIGYVAPEYGQGCEASTLGDVYSYGILLLEMMTRKRPTDGIFMEGYNLHNYVKIAMPQRVTEIVDPMLLDDLRSAAAVSNQVQEPVRDNSVRKEHCLTCILKIGLACSMESPRERMDMSDVINELHCIKNDLLVAQRNAAQR